MKKFNAAYADKPALLIIDMVKDNFVDERKLPITPLARKLIDPINRLSYLFRKNDFPVVFSTDAFSPDDFMFSGSMNPHSLAGSQGAEIIDELVRKKDDYWLPKPRFSAFFNTGLDQWLHDRQISQCVVAGIATNFCVLTSVMDALCHDFKAIILEDCTAAFNEEIHSNTLNLYRRNPLYPLLQVVKSQDLIKEMFV